MILAVLACAGPEPILKSTTYLQLHGKDQAEREAAVCGLKAERSGLAHGTNRSGNVRAHGLVATRRDGQNIYYRLASPTAKKLVGALCELYGGK